MKRLRLTVLLLLLVLFTAVALAQGTPCVRRFIIGGGGGRSTSSGGNVSLAGALGQAAAGRSSGGSVVLQSGFWVGGPAGPMSVYLPIVLRDLFTDPYERNDSFEQAWGPLISGQIYRGYFASRDDRDDYYYFDLPAPHSIEIWLSEIPTGDDYALYLYDAAHVLIAYSDEYYANEHIFIPNASANRYYVRVEPVVSTSQRQAYALQTVFR